MKRPSRILLWALPAAVAPFILASVAGVATYWWVATHHPREEVDASIGALFGDFAVCAAFIVAAIFAIMTTFKWQEASVLERSAGLAPLAIGVCITLLVFIVTALSM